MTVRHLDNTCFACIQ